VSGRNLRCSLAVGFPSDANSAREGYVHVPLWCVALRVCSGTVPRPPCTRLHRTPRPRDGLDLPRCSGLRRAQLFCIARVRDSDTASSVWDSTAACTHKDGLYPPLGATLRREGPLEVNGEAKSRELLLFPLCSRVAAYSTSCSSLFSVPLSASPLISLSCVPLRPLSLHAGGGVGSPLPDGHIRRSPFSGCAPGSAAFPKCKDGARGKKGRKGRVGMASYCAR